jgi:hypothetical protein
MSDDCLLAFVFFGINFVNSCLVSYEHDRNFEASANRSIPTLLYCSKMVHSSDVLIYISPTKIIFHKGF